MQQREILVGNSDGIGLATTRRLLAKGWSITGLSKSESTIKNSAYKPFMMSVEKAVDHVEYCIRRRPARYSAPRIAIPFLKCMKLVAKFAGLA